MFQRVFVSILFPLLLASCNSFNPAQPSSINHEKPAKFPEEAAHLLDSIEATRLDFIGIHVAAKSGTDIQASKFLGKPYWPKSMPYPVDRNGHELVLLAQVNFAEIPPLEDFPQQGILQFFVSPTESREHIWGMSMMDFGDQPFDSESYIDGLQEPDFFQVIYHKPPFQKTNLRKRFPKVNSSVLPIDREVSLSFSPQSEIVIPTDYRFEQLLGQPAWDFFGEFSQEVEKQLDHYYDSVIPKVDAKIGGYAYLVQDDPREIQPDEDWIVLLWIDSFHHEDGAMALWGDAGTAMFSIRRSELQQLDFSKVLYSWDNH